MNSKKETPDLNTTSSILATIVSIIPFLLLGMVWYMEIKKFPQSYELGIQIAAVASMFLLLGIGWVKGFPKWTVPSIGFCLLFSIFFMFITSPAFGRETPWGLWALIPLIITMLVSYLLNPTLKPLKNLGKMINEEQNVLVFAFYGIMPIIFMMEFDEITHSSVIPFIMILITLTIFGAIIYLRSSKKNVRTLTLIVTILITHTIAINAAIKIWQMVHS